MSEETLGFQTDPLFGYEELRDVLDPVTGRMKNEYNMLGLTIEEAAMRAERWWNKHARFQMPDYGKSLDYINGFGFNSRIILGCEWCHLSRAEKIQVTKQWHTHVGIPLHVFKVQTADEFDTIRKFDLAKLFGKPDFDKVN